MSGLGSSGSLPHSTSTLGRGVALLDQIAVHGVVKQETPEDEQGILEQIQARICLILCCAVFESMQTFAGRHPEGIAGEA